MKLFSLILVLLIFLFSAALFADTVYMKNGKVYNGKIVGQSRKKIRIKIGGTTRVFEKKTIKRVIYSKSAEELKKNTEAKRKAEEERKRNEARADRDKKDAEEKRRLEAERLRKIKLEKQHKIDIALGPTWHGALLRSLLVPGWGQYYQGRQSMAYIIGGAFWATATASVYMDSQYQLSRATYEDNATQFLLTSPLFLSSFGVTIPDTSVFLLPGLMQTQNIIDSRQKMEDNARYANFLRFAAGALYIWNIADVILYHPSQNQSLHMRTRYDGLDFSYQTRY